MERNRQSWSIYNSIQKKRKLYGLAKYTFNSNLKFAQKKTRAQAEFDRHNDIVEEDNGKHFNGEFTSRFLSNPWKPESEVKNSEPKLTDTIKAFNDPAAEEWKYQPSNATLFCNIFAIFFLIIS